MDDLSSYIPSDDLTAHPAVRAWSRLCGESARPSGVDVLRPPNVEGYKPCVFRIRGVGGENNSVVAKLCLKETARFERLIYERILPELPLPRLEFYGTFPSEDQPLDWVFFEDAGDDRYLDKFEEHRHAAAEWIATLHISAEPLPEVQRLPDRGPDHYLKHLRSARQLIEASQSNKVITLGQRAVLDRVDAYLQSFEDSWIDWSQLCETMPKTLAHGDWAGRNVRFLGTNGRRAMVAFDWETAGRGFPVADLASSRIYESPCCLHAYFKKVRESWPALGFEDILRMAVVGRIFRTIAGIHWGSTELVFERSDFLLHPLTQMQAFLDRFDGLRAELGGGHLKMIPVRKVFSRFGSQVDESLPIANELKGLLSGSGASSHTELRDSLLELLGDGHDSWRMVGAEMLVRRWRRHRPFEVHRLSFETKSANRSLFVKCLEPEIARRNSLVAKRWLPAIGLGLNGPPLLSSSAERNGQRVWHIYKDLGNWGLQENNPDPERVTTAVELIAKLHARFMGHPWLAECRLWGGDLGVQFCSNSVHDAIGNLERLKPPYAELCPENSMLRERLLRRLYKFRDELHRRLEVVRELGGPETLLHGDLWPQNVFVIPTRHGLQPRIIDWDHAGVGPVMYDLSTFLSRFPIDDRSWILDAYRNAPEKPNWQMPSNKELNLLFETLECARVANCVIWQAIEAGESQAAEAFDFLKEIEGWFEALQPLLPV
jgi:Ser/Thr protein kinase RdoA (MazF antagonist)